MLDIFITHHDQMLLINKVILQLNKGNYFSAAWRLMVISLTGSPAAYQNAKDSMFISVVYKVSHYCS